MTVLAEEELLSSYAGLRHAYEFHKNKQRLKEYRRLRQTSESCRVLCLLLMLIFTLFWLARVNNPIVAFWAADYYR